MSRQGRYEEAGNECVDACPPPDKGEEKEMSILEPPKEINRKMEEVIKKLKSSIQLKVQQDIIREIREKKKEETLTNEEPMLIHKEVQIPIDQETINEQNELKVITKDKYDNTTQQSNDNHTDNDITLNKRIDEKENEIRMSQLQSYEKDEMILKEQKEEKENGVIKSKFLFVGPIYGNYIVHLFEKIERVINKKGELKAVIILGLIHNEEIIIPEPPCPIYILATPSTNQLKQPIPTNVYILNGLGDLKIGTFTLVYSSIDEAEDDVSYQETKDLATKYYLQKSCDFFISTYWPSYILNELDNNEKPAFHVDYSYVASIIARACCPRYHLTIGKEYYERVEFTNKTEPRMQNNNLIYPTKFYSLNPETEERNLKSIIFLKLISVEEGALQNNTRILGVNPYSDIKLTQSKFNEFKKPLCQSHVTIVSSIPTNKQENRQHVISTSETNKKSLYPQNYKINNCWFCLSNSKSELKLIISCGYYNYLSYTKGPLIDNHFQLIPIHHIQSYKMMSLVGLSELNNYYTSLRNFYRVEKKEFIVFETVVMNQNSQCHTFLQIFPFELTKSEDLIKHIVRFITPLNGQCQLIQLSNPIAFNEIPSQTTYIYFTLSGIVSYYFIVQNQIKPTIAREIMVMWFNLPDRLIWKQCQEEYSVEERKARDLRHKFSNFDTVI
ncbi:hypothetical protein ENUP19_0262G0003 [Entamoeba nuttalli]|uniref:Cwf19-like C-terminal domain-containing protein n=1 Tax=Entamoeba nuttalli TaxID=412467 RepID=A0ABQ0DSE3_9EUKA